MNWQEITQRIFDAYGNLPKNKLAERLEIDKSIVSQWTTSSEKSWRHPTWDVLQKVTKDTGVTWDWLLTGKKASATKMPPATRAEGKTSDRDMAALTRATTTIQLLLNHCLIDIAQGKAAIGPTANMFNGIVGEISEYRKANDLDDVKYG